MKPLFTFVNEHINLFHTVPSDFLQAAIAQLLMQLKNYPIIESELSDPSSPLNIISSSLRNRFGTALQHKPSLRIKR